MEATFQIQGMTCGGCETSVRNALARLGLEVEVSLEKAQAKVRGSFDDKDIEKAIEAAGFAFGGRVSTDR